MSEETTVYQFVGGDEAFRALVNAFYTGVEQDPILSPMYPDADFEGARERLFLFLTQYWGGPDRYNAQRGHPRLRMRHFPFAIGQEARDAWMRHMLAAVEEVGIPEPARRMMLEYFESVSTFLINQPQPGG